MTVKEDFMKKKLISLTLALLMLGVVLAGCSGGSNEETSSQPT